MTTLPTVSIVVATYNRARILGHAIRSVLDSTFADWELIVVGDCCTDDTEACVRSFHDPRIRFDNLPRNCGDQSGPNNRGIELARGRYLAFLNHDDLHLSGHLAACVAALEAGADDLVWQASATLLDFTEQADAAAPRWMFTLDGVPPAAGYSPFAFYTASSWVLRRETASRVGPWPSPESIWVTSSQAWLFRAWRAGMRLRFLPGVGVVRVASGQKPGSYAQRDSPEHEFLTRRLKDDARFRHDILQNAAITLAQERAALVGHAPVKSLLRAIAFPVHAALTAAGIHPWSLNAAARFRRKGGEVRRHRKVTGID